ncbi:hypothetical protein KBD71_02130 [Candidatus Woesebacteria bacterium]|nr:hypothetical protein [Candidatus Woesebacteria bacterium]
MNGSEKVTPLQPDLSKLYAYQDFEIRASSAVTFLTTIAALYKISDTEEIQKKRDAIFQVPLSEKLQIHQLLIEYDKEMDPNDTLNRVARIGKSLRLAIVYLELKMQLNALDSLLDAMHILNEPIREGKEDELVHPNLTDGDILNVLIRLHRRIAISSKNTLFSSETARDE